MAVNVKEIPGANRAAEAANLEWAYRSIVSSSQQKLFRTVLTEAQSVDDPGTSCGTDSLQADLQSIQVARDRGQNIDAMKQGGVSAPRGGEMNDLATSALLNLAAVTGRRDQLAAYYSQAVASRRAGAATAPGASSASQPLSGRPLPREVGRLGELSARFESGEMGIKAIGYDEKGGTSYGSYQIASRVGTMRQFLSYLEDHAPEWARRLKAAGPADTGSRQGGMPAEWQKIAEEDPVRFARLQRDFIEESHYFPAMEEIYERTGVNIGKQPRALREVLWSTAVQHGPRGAANIFCRAIEESRTEGGPGPLRDLVRSIYDSRSTQFSGSNPDIRGSVLRRFREERALALALLAAENRPSEAPA
ncbi:MAG TPA: hypothetical protein PLM79_11105 [Syntrophobacteraceae bacterium]|nr:hypothetical protein [Syntrophobacteraceae bacterium]